MNKKNFLIFFLSLILLVSTVSAWMPEDHTQYNLNAASQYPNTPVGQLAVNYMDDIIACDVLTDISVFYYFSEGFTAIGKEYRATHSQNLCLKMVELAGNDPQALACAYGVCSHHVHPT